ncbi:MAG TPA: glucose dehydrogenase [Chryseosolibacter sp.]
MKKSCVIVGALALIFLATGCYRMRTSHGGGEIKTATARKVRALDIALHPGYSIAAVASGLTFPTAVDFDDNGDLYVLEAGYAYGEVWTTPALKRIEKDGSTTTIATGEKNGPWTGLTFFNGYFYVSEGGEAEGGRILRISKEGDTKVLVSDLPSVGDHHTNGPVIKDGYIYFGQGTATNSAVVGEDNASFGWLKRKREFHDIPCKDLVLAGENYESSDVFGGDPKAKISTGAFSPFGETTSDGQVIKGQTPCTGSILRIPIAGGKAEMVAWGLRNPFGLAIAPDGKIYTTENAFDDRGSRPVWGAGDVLWEVENDKWYGWPDFSAAASIVNREEFRPPARNRVKALLKMYPGNPPTPVAIFAVHSSASGFDFSRNAQFGFAGQAFVAQFGDMAPGVGKVLSPVGFKIVRVDVRTGTVRDFAVNRGKRNGPASWLKTGGLERPVSARFNRAGDELYIVDFGVLRMEKEKSHPVAKTGVIWKIVKNETAK